VALAPVLAVVLAACGGGSSPGTGGNAAEKTTTTTTVRSAPTSTSTSVAPAPSSGPLQAGAPIALPFSADRVAVAESPDGAVFAAPQTPSSTAGDVAWVVDGNGPAAVAEHVPAGIAALAADGSNFYVATYGTVYSYDRASGNQDGQWPLPPISTANSSKDDLVAMAAAGGAVDVSITQGTVVSVYRITPASTSAPRLVVRGLGATVGPDGSVFYETAGHHLAVRRPGGATTVGPALAATPNRTGGGVQYLVTTAGGAVWVNEPAGQGLDAQYTTYDAATLAEIDSFSGTVAAVVADTSGGPLVLDSTGAGPGCPASGGAAPSGCVQRVDVHGHYSDQLSVGAAVTLTGPAPAVVVSDTATGQFDLVRLS
jgi:hypothetical protein